MPGIPELLIILVIVLLVFGAGKLPAIGDSLGRSIKNFKRSAAGSDEVEVGKKAELNVSKVAELDAADDDEEYAAFLAQKRAKKQKQATED